MGLSEDDLDELIARMDAPLPEGSIHDAAQRGDTDALRALLDRGTAVDEPDAAGRTALIHASQEGHREAVELLLTRGANVNAEPNQFTSPLHEAVWHSHIDIAQVLVDAGASPRLESTHWEALNRAVTADDLPLIKALLVRGADPNLHDNVGRSALSFAKSREAAALLRWAGAADWRCPECGFTRFETDGVCPFCQDQGISHIAEELALSDGDPEDDDPEAVRLPDPPWVTSNLPGIETVLEYDDVRLLFERLCRLQSDRGSFPDALSGYAIGSEDLDLRQFFDPNRFLTEVFDHVAIEPGHILDYAYVTGPNGNPIVYAGRESDEKMPLETAKRMSERERLEQVRFDPTPMGFLQFVVFTTVFEQFYLKWHGAYDDLRFVCGDLDMRDVIRQIGTSVFDTRTESVDWDRPDWIELAVANAKSAVSGWQSGEWIDYDAAALADVVDEEFRRSFRPNDEPRPDAWLTAERLNFESYLDYTRMQLTDYVESQVEGRRVGQGLKGIDLRPRVRIVDDKAIVTTVVFTNWGGLFWRETTLMPPNVVLGQKRHEIYQYSCGLDF